MFRIMSLLYVIAEGFKMDLNLTLNTSEVNLVQNVTNRSTVDLVSARYIVIAFTILSVYLLTVLGLYSFKTRNRRNIPKVSHLCLLLAICSVLVCINKLSELWFDTGGLISCSAYHQSAAALYGLGLGFVYTNLWARQRKLYSDDLLVNTVSRFSRIVSATVILGIYCLLLFVYVAYITALQFEADVFPCHIIWYPLSSLLPIVVFFISTCFVFQLVLLLLIVNPLLSGGNLCHILFCAKPNNDIHIMLKRLALCACACVFSSILLNIAILFDAVGIICVYWGNLVALDLIINTVSTVCSHADWPQRLLPMFPRLCISARRNSSFSKTVTREETISDKSHMITTPITSNM